MDKQQRIKEIHELISAKTKAEAIEILIETIADLETKLQKLINGGNQNG